MGGEVVNHLVCQSEFSTLHAVTMFSVTHVIRSIGCIIPAKSDSVEGEPIRRGSRQFLEPNESDVGLASLGLDSVVTGSFSWTDRFNSKETRGTERQSREVRLTSPLYMGLLARPPQWAKEELII